MRKKKKKGEISRGRGKKGKGKGRLTEKPTDGLGTEKKRRKRIRWPGA